jgi:hypothetical protein
MIANAESSFMINQSYLITTEELAIAYSIASMKGSSFHGFLRLG